MDRVKEFNATGVAPNGRLYAGDLLAIMDAAAGLSEFDQTVDVSTLRVGDTTIQIIKHGTAEMRITAALRADGILRGLGGIIPGAFTIAQRNAIAAGLAPYGIAILNSETNQWEWNAGTDGARDWQPLSAGSDVGLLGDRPQADDVPSGSTYFATDQVVDYVSDGTNWHRKSTPAGAFQLWEGAAAPPGYVLYDGTNLPGSTGIHADIFAHLGGLAKPNWKQRVPVGLDASQVEFDTLKEMGGAKTHVLSIAEIPSHNHGGGSHGHTYGRHDGSVQSGGGPFNAVALNLGTFGTAASGTILNSEGGDAAHPNLQPYRVCHYIGKL